MQTRMKPRRAPGPRGHLLLGCLQEFRRDTIGLLQECARTYGDVVRLRIGPVTAHLVNHPDHAEQVLVKRSRNYDKNTRSVAKIRATCGRSLLSADGGVWERHRRLIQPVFLQQQLRQYTGVIADQIDISLQEWEVLAKKGEELEMVTAMLQLTLRIAARVLFGADVAADAQLIEHSLRIVMQDTWRRIGAAIDMSAVSPAFQRPMFRRAVQNLDNVVYRIIADRRRQPAPADDLLSLLLAAHQLEGEQGLSDRELRDAVITLLLAGHETTANALAWALLLVAQHPEVEERLTNESRHSGHPSPAGVCSDTSLVFQEAIRLYPSVWILERRAIAEDVIGGFRIPAGSTVLISPYLLHRHPDFWDCPEEFKPERFTAAESPARNRAAYLPFGMGPHRCIGQHMSLLFAEQVLQHIYRRFRLRLVPGQSFQPYAGITLQHAEGIRMTLESLK